VLSGLVVKGYAVLLITMYCRVFTLPTVRAFHIHDAVFALGFGGMILGSVMALKETHAKRMLAYSSVAQLGYVFMGVGLGTPAGIAAAVFQILAHAFTKPLLFVSVGRLAASVHHDKQLKALRGAAWSCPLAGLGFGVGALSMVGIPLFAGFSAKVNFSTSAIFGEEKIALTLFVLALSSVLNALYYIPALINIWSEKNPESSVPKKDPTAAAAIVLLIGGVLFLGLGFSRVMEIIVRGLELM
jgi:multicomponent Na+:H+ antiporter subunit D